MCIRDRTDPQSPASDNTPRISGNAGSDTTVALYTDDACTVPAVNGTGTGSATGSSFDFTVNGIEVTVPDDSETTFWGTATDDEDNVSECSLSSITYIEDSSPPAPPTFTGTDPESPGFDNWPRIQGEAEPGSRVVLYLDSSCTDPVSDSSAS